MQFIRIMHFGCGISFSAVLSESSIFYSIGTSSIISTVEFVRTLEYIFIVPSSLNPAIDEMNVCPPNTRPNGFVRAASPAFDSGIPRSCAYLVRGFIPSREMIFLIRVSACVIFVRLPVGLKMFSFWIKNGSGVFTKRITAPS
ncbi:MAG: hypothetical protein SOX64_08180 [Treponema sp.]|nr:hypothetical protein [Treponema sp.]